jgi:uncharacterized membrane protein
MRGEKRGLAVSFGLVLICIIVMQIFNQSPLGGLEPIVVLAVITIGAAVFSLRVTKKER